MRIAMIGQKGLPAHSGGVERHVDDLATRLAAAKHEVFAYCRRAYALNQNCPDEYVGVKLVYVPTIVSKYFETVIYTFFASIHVLFMPVDIIHYHGIGPSLFAWIPRIFKPRAKVIATFHSQDYYQQKWGVCARLVFRLGELVACTMTHQTIAISQTIRDHVKKIYGRDAIYIPNAVTLPNRARPQAITKFGLSRGSYILSVSRLVKHKGIHTLIDAYNDLSMRLSPLPTLVIVGSSSFTDDYVANLHTRANGNPNILFLGEQSGDTLAELYSNARLFIQASESEGLSYALLEAMSYGCPVLVSDIAENTEVLPCVGYTFRCGDTSNLSAQLESILLVKNQNTDARALYYEHIKKNYNFDTLFPQTLHMYQEKA